MKNTLEIPEGMEICPDCNGKGEATYSCCGGGLVTGDYQICPTCKEHLGEEECNLCEGKGYVPKETPASDSVDLGLQAENKMDEMKERDWIADVYPTGPAWTGD